MANGKKLLVMATTFPRWKGDTEPTFIYELSLGLAGKGYKVIVLAPHFKGAKQYENLRGIEIYRFRYFWPESLETLCYNGGILPNIKKRPLLSIIQVPLLAISEFVAARKILKRKKIDLIHAHWIIPQGWIASILKRTLKTKYITTAHAGDVFPLKKGFLKAFGKKSIKYSDFCTANSNYTKSKLNSILKPKNLEVIPMGVDLHLFSGKKKLDVKRRYGIKGKLILSVGRLAEKKGLTYLISALHLLKNKFPDIRLLIIGDGPEKGNLMRQVNSLGLGNRVIFTGKIKNDLLPSYYASADIFVLPSIITKNGDTEGLGVVLLEAISSGTPVIASNVGGIPDIVKDGKTGLLVSQKNPKQLATAISKLLSNPELSRRLVKNGKGHIRETYNWKNIADRFDKIIRKTIEK